MVGVGGSSPPSSTKNSFKESHLQSNQGGFFDLWSLVFLAPVIRQNMKKFQDTPGKYFIHQIPFPLRNATSVSLFCLNIS